MSDLAIAAVTATLRGLLLEQTRADVTTLPPDKASDGIQGSRLNLFLYHITYNSAWRNQTISPKVNSSMRDFPPLALNLHYLITAYGDDQVNETDHRLLGTAMRVLHDSPVLTPQQIQNLIGDPLSQAQLERQIEPVRVTPEPLLLDEMSRLWSTFQTQYRVSASYQAAVVLLESSRQAPDPLPVLKRGPADRGAEVSIWEPWQLEGVEYRDLRERLPALPAAQLNDVVTLRGGALPGQNCVVVVRDPNRAPTPAEPDADIIARLKPESGSAADRIFVKLDEAAGDWVCGSLKVSLEQRSGAGKPRRSRSTFLDLAPSIRDGSGLTAIVTTENNRRKLVVRSQPRLPGRRADNSLPDISLLLTPLAAESAPAPIGRDLNSLNSNATTVVFDVANVPPGDYRVRLRADMVESLMMKREGLRLDFDDLQMVRL